MLVYYAEELILRVPLQVSASAKYSSIEYGNPDTMVCYEEHCFCVSGPTKPRLQHVWPDPSEAMHSQHHGWVHVQQATGLLHLCLSQVKDGEVSPYIPETSWYRFWLRILTLRADLIKRPCYCTCVNDYRFNLALFVTSQVPRLWEPWHLLY